MKIFSSNTHYKLIFFDIYMSENDEKISLTKITIVCLFFVLVPVESLFVKLDDNLEKDK